MLGICHQWSRGRLISPSPPVGDDWYLNLCSQKRPTGRNLGGNRSVRRSGTTSRGTVVLVSRSRMRSFLGLKFLPYDNFSCQLTSSCTYTGSLKLGIGSNTVHCSIKRYFTEFTFVFSFTTSNSLFSRKRRAVLLAIPENTTILFVCAPKFCISIGLLEIDDKCKPVTV